mgnify:CR=1 FL=1
MKKLLILLFSFFLLITPSAFADDISDFEIEGISIGDSLLDYMTEDYILKEIERTKDYYLYLNEPNKYAHVFLGKDFWTYGALTFFVKNNGANKYVTNKNKNEKYTILAVRGKIDFIEDFDSCIQERNKISESLSIMFSNAQRDEEIHPFSSDPSGNSIWDGIYFEFDSGGQIDVYCTDLEETFRIKRNAPEGLSVSILTSEIRSWLQNKK